MKFLFIAINNMGELTGGDTIWINLYKNWENTHLFGNKKAIDLLNNFYSPIKPTIWNILKNTIKQSVYGIKYIVKFIEYDYVYSVSDFYPDLLTALIYKLKYPKTKWIAGYYLIAPSPFAQNSPYVGLLRIKGTLYWLMQRISLKLVNKWADIVFITSEPDKKWFPNKKVIVARGGVSRIGERKEPYYDAVFIGRLHYQKGVLELMNIWRKVNEKLPNAKLALIGDGPLMEEVRKKAPTTVDILGYKNGDAKYSIIEKSKIVVHPATFDSGGMACAEAMAFGLPAVGFMLPAFTTYYPYGMVKCANADIFAEQIIRFLTSKQYYDYYSSEAKRLIENEWIWEKQAERIFNEVIKCSK